MAAPIIKHELVPEPGDDPNHPIPYLGSLDVMSVKTGGGADLIIVVASPLMADERSKTRLLDKIRGYLGFIGSNEFHAQAGEPNPSNTQVVVKLHPNSAPQIHDFLVRCEPWVQRSNATLQVEFLRSSELA